MLVLAFVVSTCTTNSKTFENFCNKINLEHLLSHELENGPKLDALTASNYYL